MYISSQGAQRLREYKYSGSDGSYVYKYFHSPLADSLVQKLPRWLAPNAITLLAFSHVALSHWLLAVGPGAGAGEEAVEGWKYVLSGYLYFAYAVLDNLDGKQARRLGASSPAGLVLDHGCDALVTVMMSMNMLRILDFNPDTELLWICTAFAVPVVAFFFATWEELLVGTLDLPVVGVNEANLVAIASHVFQAIQPGYMHWHVCFFGMRLNRAVVLGFVALAVALVGNSIRTVVRVGRVKLSKALWSTLPFWLTLGVGLGWTLYSPAKIYAQRPRSVFWLLGLSFSKLVSHMQIAHVAEDEFRPWRKTLLVPVLLFTGNHFLQLVDESACLSVSLAVALLSWTHMAVFAFRQMLAALDIPFLTVPNNKRKVK